MATRRHATKRGVRGQAAAVPIVAALLGLCLLSAPAWAELGRPAEPVPREIDTILQRLAEAQPLPVGLEFRQEIVFKAFLFTWRFESQVLVTANGFEAETLGAPAFVPENLAQELVELGQSVALFELSLLETDDGESLVLQGSRKGYQGAGPKEATFWIDPKDWVVTRAEATYSWGTLYVTQEYDQWEGAKLLSRQNARATPYGFTLDVRYQDYHFP